MKKNQQIFKQNFYIRKFLKMHKTQCIAANGHCLFTRQVSGQKLHFFWKLYKKNHGAIRKIREILSQNMLFVNQGKILKVNFCGYLKFTSGCIQNNFKEKCSFCPQTFWVNKQYLLATIY